MIPTLDVKPERDRAPGHLDRIVRMTNSTAYHRIDIDVKLGMFGEQSQLEVENLEAFLRNFVRLDVIDRDLHVLETGAIEALDAIRREQIGRS